MKGDFNLSAAALKHRQLTLFFLIVIALGGIAAYFQLGQREDPDFAFRAMVIRTLWPGATAAQVDRQVTDPTSVLSHYKAMLAFRKAHPALIRGTIKTLDAPDGVLAFLREGEGERLYCVFNMSEKPAAVTLPAGFHVTASDAPGIDYEPQEGALSLAPFGAYIGIVR